VYRKSRHCSTAQAVGFFSKSKIGRQYGGFRKFINEKEAYKAGGYPIPRRFRKRTGNRAGTRVFILLKNSLQVFVLLFM